MDTSAFDPQQVKYALDTVTQEILKAEFRKALDTPERQALLTQLGAKLADLAIADVKLSIDTNPEYGVRRAFKEELTRLVSKTAAEQVDLRQLVFNFLKGEDLQKMVVSHVRSRLERDIGEVIREFSFSFERRGR